MKPSGMSLQEYMTHSTKSGGKKNYLASWKTKDPYAVTVWLSTQSSIYTLWRHNFQKVEPREKDGEKTREVWQDRKVCWESEEILKAQYRRDWNTGERDHPPQICPHCIMIEDVRSRCFLGFEIKEEMLRTDSKANMEKIKAAMRERGALDWLEPLFRFEGTDPSKTVVLHAGGIYNAFGHKDLSEVDKKAMATVPKSQGGPIFAKDSFKQSQWAKCEYVYVVVNNDDVASGLAIAIEPNLLGDKMKTEIGKQMKRRGPEKGNPILNPYAFRWEHNPAKDIEFGKKYDVVAMDELKVTPAIDRLIRDENVPDVGPLLERFNARSHRAMLERHALVQLPWDEYFKAAFAQEGQRAPAAERPAPEVGRQPIPVQAKPPAVEEDELVECDDGKGNGCGKAMKASDSTCPHCSLRYDVVPQEPPPPPPPPPMRKRGDVKKDPSPATVAAAPKGSLGAISPPEQVDDAESPGDANEDDLPF